MFADKIYHIGKPYVSLQTKNAGRKVKVYTYGKRYSAL